MEFNWNQYENGASLGTIGSENGKIIKDEENPLGARVTLEENGSIAPFVITVSIYGLMFHTEFYGSLETAEIQFSVFKSKIEQILEHYSIDEGQRDSLWNEKHNKLMDQMTN